MNSVIRFSSIENFIELVAKLKVATIAEQDLKNCLSHPDYAFEFRRYEGRVSKSEYIDYLLHICHLNEQNITNMDLKAHHSYCEDLLANIEFYMDSLNVLETLLTPKLFEEQVAIALKGLPDGIVLPDLNFIFTIGIGQSFGYAYENAMHFDFLQLARNYSMEDFCSTLAHEIHHIGMSVVNRDVDGDAVPLEALYYAYFAGEGLAVKYCNNAEGVMSKSIDSGAKNKGLDTFSWKYLNDDFNETMTQFKRDVINIRNGQIQSRNELHERLSEYWMSPYIEGQSQNDIPKLKHFRLYSFGNEIWGIIHDCFGKDTVYETLKNPEYFPKVYNQALEHLGMEVFKI